MQNHFISLRNANDVHAERGIFVLETPYGHVLLTVDGKPVPYTCAPTQRQSTFSDVDGAYLLQYDFHCDGQPHTLCCQLEGAPVAGEMENGQWQEALSFYVDQGKLTMGCEGDFVLPLANGYDFDGYYEPSGICLRLNEHTASRRFSFAVAWLTHCTPGNDVQTWLATDVHSLCSTSVSRPVKGF